MELTGLGTVIQLLGLGIGLDWWEYPLYKFTTLTGKRRHDSQFFDCVFAVLLGGIVMN